MGEVKADLPALHRFAGRSADRGADFTDLRGRMNAVHLDRGAFGYIPGIGNRVSGAYEQFVGGCEDAVTSIASMMDSLAHGVRGAADAYAASDRAAADRVHGAGGRS